MILKLPYEDINLCKSNKDVITIFLLNLLFFKNTCVMNICRPPICNKPKTKIYASKFNLPIVSFIDTPGAYPGKGAEEF